jgi:1,4-alpha-glucan branching enzyme
MKNVTIKNIDGYCIDAINATGATAAGIQDSVYTNSNFENSTLTYVRRAEDPADFLVAACNFTPVPRFHHRLGVPETGWYEEVFNSDSMHYAGSNMGNGPGVMADCMPSHGQPASIQVCLPPLATVVFKPRG